MGMHIKRLYMHTHTTGPGGDTKASNANVAPPLDQMVNREHVGCPQLYPPFYVGDSPFIGHWDIDL